MLYYYSIKFYREIPYSKIYYTVHLRKCKSIFGVLVFKLDGGTALYLISQIERKERWWDRRIRTGEGFRENGKTMFLTSWKTCRVIFSVCTSNTVLYPYLLRLKYKNQVTPERENCSLIFRADTTAISLHFWRYTHYLPALYHHFRRSLVVAATRPPFYLPFPLFHAIPLLHRQLRLRGYTYARFQPTTRSLPDSNFRLNFILQL